jgi:RNA polymerase sigma-70 factor (ECF subfamily)
MTRELVERAMNGDRDAFALLAERSLPKIVGAAGLIIKDAFAAEDVAQDALLRAWRDLPSLRDPDRFDAWLHRLMVHASLDHLRKHRHDRRSEALDPFLEPSTAPNLDSLADRDELDRGLRRLPDSLRVVVVLRYFVDLGDAEIAAATSLPIGTVKSRHHRALALLRAELAADARAAAIQEQSA